MAEHNELGKWGEDIAVEYLLDKQYRIVARDWKLGKRDIDIIAYSPEGYLVFVEVKTRRNEVFMQTECAVNYSKMKSIMRCANAYVKYYHIDNPIRFDIIAVIGTNIANYEVRHTEDAFGLSL